MQDQINGCDLVALRLFIATGMLILDKYSKKKVVDK